MGNNESNVVGNVVLEKYQRLIYKVLAKHGIRPGQADYEDYVQEVRLYLYLLASECLSLAEFEEQYSLPFLYRKLAWYVRAYRRKLIRSSTVVSMDEEGVELVLDSEAFDELELQLMVVEFYRSLNEVDQKKLLAILTDTQLSRQMRSYYRLSLKEKFQKFLKLF